MSDVFTKEKRSEVMSRIRGKNNKETELALIQIFRANNITGWRRNYKLFGKPDFVFPKYRLAIFVDGCFWHVCPDHCVFPKNNEEFWKVKLSRNKDRDVLVNKTLCEKGWVVMRIWEHDLKKSDKVANRVTTIICELISKKVTNKI